MRAKDKRWRNKLRILLKRAKIATKKKIEIQSFLFNFYLILYLFLIFYYLIIYFYYILFIFRFILQ